MNVDNVIKVLNEAFAADPVAVAKLVGARVPCNADLANHPTIQVSERDGNFTVGVVGLLNGFLGVNPETGAGYLAAAYDDQSNLIGFQEFVPTLEPDEGEITSPEFV